MGLLDVLSKISTLYHSFTASVYLIFNAEWPKSRFDLSILLLFFLRSQGQFVGSSPCPEQSLLGYSSPGLDDVNHGGLNDSNMAEKYNRLTGFLSAWPRSRRL
jgi:hypothetical protein